MSKQQQQQSDDARDLQAAGVPQEHHDEVRALRPLALAHGVDWPALLAVVQQHKGELKEALGVIRSVLSAVRGQQQPPEGKDQARV